MAEGYPAAVDFADLERNVTAGFEDTMKFLEDPRHSSGPRIELPRHGQLDRLWNSQTFGNFKDADGRSAVPYLLVFQTK